MAKTKRKKYSFGLGHGFAKALKIGVDASVAKRKLGLGDKTQDWLYQRRPQ